MTILMGNMNRILSGRDAQKGYPYERRHTENAA